MRVFHLKTTSLRGRQNVYGYILVGFSFLVLTFLTVKTLAPEIRTEAATQTASQTVGPYTMSMANDSAATINITPTATQAVYTGTNNLTVSNTCDSGAIITMKMSGTSNTLTRTATDGDSLTKTINATNTTGALVDNSWGYSTNSGSTYAAVPISSAAPATIYNGTTTASSASVPLMFGVKTDNNMPSGTYTGDVVYTMTPNTGCNSYSINWDYAGGTKNSSYAYPSSLSWGATVNLTGSTPTRSGYTFTGWSNGSSSFTASDTAANLNPTNAKTVTVTAQWKSNDPAIPTGACSGSYTLVNVNLAQNASQGFDYTGNVQCAYLQKEGYYKLEVWGAQGGTGNETMANTAGYGGYSYGNIYSLANSAIYIVVGQYSTSSGTTKNYNGGGPTHPSLGGHGGGATHISTTNCGELINCSSANGKAGILIVAGGGGGAKYTSNSNAGTAGSGGGYIGGNGVKYGNSTNPTGGTQTSGGSVSGSSYNGNGSFGLGGGGDTQWWNSGGGGGWYGGGTCWDCGAAGGSGYIGNSLLLSDKQMHQYRYYTGTTTSNCTTSTAIDTYTVCTASTGHAQQNAANTGNGYARITYIGTTR